jgi:UPF0755 protein
MRRIVTLVLVLVLLAAAFFAWRVFGSGTGFNEKTQTFIIDENARDKSAVMAVLEKNEVVSSPALFGFIGSRLGVWDHIRPGKYEVKKGTSLLNIARMLKNGRLAEFKLVINKIRLKEDLAHLISRSFKPDSVAVMNFLNSNDSLKPFAVDTSMVLTLIIPDTYKFYWNTSLNRIFRRLSEEKDAFWKHDQRRQRAEQIGMSEDEVYILASIVEEETNYADDKAKIASVYINRLKGSMPLQACPTIKYAMKDFSLTRIYDKYLFNPSPYNTYRRKGLPPGPICTPSPKTIDIVLNAPKTDYLFFVAKSDFSGHHHFSSNYAEHMEYARAYQKALDAYMARKQQKQTP